MTRAHATQKGAVGLDLGDEKGNKEMIDAPMLKQVTTSGYMYSFIRLNTRGLGREDDPNSARSWPTHSNTAMKTSTMRLSGRNHVDAHQRRISHGWLEVIVRFRALRRLCRPGCRILYYSCTTTVS
jgi:hypothetical protein